MKIRKLLPFFFSGLCAVLSAAEKPHSLMTDLLEHTDRTWQNGYPSNVPIWEAENAIEELQYVEIASSRPSFGWIVPGDGKGVRQVSYRIVVSETANGALDGKGVVWDSGTVESNKSTAVLYGGEDLEPDKTYFWRVKLTTNTDGESAWSDAKAFRTASELSEYAASHYPQEKTFEYASDTEELAESSVLYDFGKAAFAQPLLTVNTDAECDTLVVHVGETVKNGAVDRKPGGTIRYQKYEIPLKRGMHTYRIKLRKDGRNTGSDAIKMPGYIGEVLPFRYMEMELSGSSAEGAAAEENILEIYPGRDAVHYPFDDFASSFECSNDTLNQIWGMCKYSIKATSFAGIYVDGDRERIPYEADALINQLCHYGVDREYSMARRSHEYLLNRPTWPTEWILQSVLIAWYDYMYTGDSRSLKANYDVLKARTLLALREENGLISTTTGRQSKEFLASIKRRDNIRDIVDWPHTGILGLNKHEGGEADGFVFTDYNAVTNAYHYEALKIMGKIAMTLGMTQEQEYFEKEAHDFLDRFNKVFFDKKLGRYVDGDTTKHASLHANMFPVAFGMVPSDKIEGVVEYIRSRQMACSVYGSQFLMDALYEAADADYALHMLTKTDDRGWYNMLRVGSTISLEAWDNKYKPNQDWNHAWGAVPANTIPRKLMGVEPLSPGFERVRIKPQIASLAWAKAVVPTIKGGISLDIENKDGQYTMRVGIPANMEAEVYLPLLAKKCDVTVDGEVRKTKRVAGQPFVALGNIGSGTYEIIMKY